jgi:hypothetical protein
MSTKENHERVFGHEPLAWPVLAKDISSAVFDETQRNAMKEGLG